jgi:hypothetical protein
MRSKCELNFKDILNIDLHRVQCGKNIQTYKFNLFIGFGEGELTPNLYLDLFEWDLLVGAMVDNGIW